jgi:hypothetical protein
MTIYAKVLKDSVSDEGVRVTTFEVRYPRFIHAELMTHRDFSRNASSSRAIPVKKMIKDIRRDPAMPVHWGQNQPGMQAHTELTGWRRSFVQKTWVAGMYVMTSIASLADKLGAHKQIVNRMIEPWAHITVVITATNYSNFFALRLHKDAQPEIKALAEAMYEVYRKSTPLVLKQGIWHLPYVELEDWIAGQAYMAENGIKNIREDTLYDTLTRLMIQVSVARCARTSYKLHDGTKTTFEKDIGLYEKLVGSEPLHASPAEHQCTADYKVLGVTWQNSHLHGNLKGMIQYRKMLPGEYVSEY